jgi:hypothetical protein
MAMEGQAVMQGCDFRSRDGYLSKLVELELPIAAQRDDRRVSGRAAAEEQQGKFTGILR